MNKLGTDGSNQIYKETRNKVVGPCYKTDLKIKQRVIDMKYENTRPPEQPRK
jgi:hypothetical protein